VGAVQEGEYNAKVARNNARVARWQAMQAMSAIGEQERSVYSAAAQARGRNIAGAAAAGIDTSTSSVANMFAASEVAAAQDIAALRSNAAMEAWGYRNQALEYAAQAKMAKGQSLLGAFGTGLGAVGSAISSSMNIYAKRV
jgi:hypothetical protein